MEIQKLTCVLLLYVVAIFGCFEICAAASLPHKSTNFQMDVQVNGTQTQLLLNEKFRDKNCKPESEFLKPENCDNILVCLVIDTLGYTCNFLPNFKLPVAPSHTDGAPRKVCCEEKEKVCVIVNGQEYTCCPSTFHESEFCNGNIF